MSLMLLAGTLLDRLRIGARALRPPTPFHAPSRETPHHRRERLRQEVLSRGGVLGDVETIPGDCPAQTAQQIEDLSRWLTQH